MPDFDVKIPDVLGGQQKAATLAQMLNANKLQQQLAPLQVQEQQEKAKQSAIQTQQQQMQIESQKAMMAMVAGGELNKFAGVDTSDGTGFDAAGAYQHMMAMGRILPEHASQLISSFQTVGKNESDIRKNNAEAGAAQANIRDKGLKVLADSMGSVLDSPSSKFTEARDAFRQELIKNPKKFAGVPQQDLALAYAQADTPEHFQAAVGAIGIQSQLADFHKSKSEASGTEATTGQKMRAAAPPTAGQLTNAVTTLNTYAAIPQNMRVGLVAEMKAAPDWETLQKVQTRADAVNESFQRSADAREQAMAMKDVGLQNLVAGKLVTEDQKLGSALDQTGGIRGLLDMSKGGNQAATNAALTRFAEHEIVEGGVKRMNQLEYENLAMKLGSFGRKFSAWVDSGFKGEMPPATNAEIHAILDAEDQAANAGHDRNVGYITNRYVVPGAGGKKVSAGKTGAAAPPSGATHIVPGRDGKNHYTNAAGTVDLGVAP